MYGWRSKIGFMLPSSCLVFEQEFARITRGLDGVIGVPARLLITDTDAAGLASMNDHIALAARQLATCDPDLVVYMCTSGSFMDGSRGESELRRRLTDLTGKPVITTSQAVLEAHRALDIRRPVMLTPYDENLTNREIAWLKSNGVDVVDSRFGDIADNLARGTQPPEQTIQLARRLDRRNADGVFLSCAKTGLPVISSSVATTWLALRTTDVREPITQFGRLLTL